MYFEKKFQETVPTWSGKRGIPGVILPKYEPINLPVKRQIILSAAVLELARQSLSKSSFVIA